MREDWRAGKTELIEAFEFLFQVFLSFAKLAAVTFVKDKDDLLVVNGKISFGLHQVIKLLDGGDNDFVVIFINITL